MRSDQQRLNWITRQKAVEIENARQVRTGGGWTGGRGILRRCSRDGNGGFESRSMVGQTNLMSSRSGSFNGRQRGAAWCQSAFAASSMTGISSRHGRSTRCKRGDVSILVGKALTIGDGWPFWRPRVDMANEAAAMAGRREALRRQASSWKRSALPPT